MKRIVIIAFALMALTSFGSQQTQADEARARRIAEVQRDRVRHIAEVQRARAERIKREIDRAGSVESVERAERAEISKIYYQASAEASERNRKASEKIIRWFCETGIKKNNFNCHPTPTKAKKKPRNSLRSYDTRRENNRFERSAPARRRK